MLHTKLLYMQIIVLVGSSGILNFTLTLQISREGLSCSL